MSQIWTITKYDMESAVASQGPKTLQTEFGPMMVHHIGRGLNNFFIDGPQSSSIFFDFMGLRPGETAITKKPGQRLRRKDGLTYLVNPDGSKEPFITDIGGSSRIHIVDALPEGENIIRSLRRIRDKTLHQTIMHSHCGEDVILTQSERRKLFMILAIWGWRTFNEVKSKALGQTGPYSCTRFDPSFEELIIPSVLKNLLEQEGKCDDPLEFLQQSYQVGFASSFCSEE